MRNDQTQRLGPDLQQLSTFCAAFREQSAQCPVYHIKVAIEFKNSPLFERGTGEYQLKEVIAVNPYGLSTDILSRGYTFTDKVLDVVSEFNQTAHVFVVPLNTKKLPVSFITCSSLLKPFSMSTLTALWFVSHRWHMSNQWM